MERIPVAVDLSAFAALLTKHPPKKGDDWNEGRYSKIKEKIKEHYSIIQDDICVYCKIHTRHGGYGEPIEHIVPKADKPKWMFIPENLALSCYPCNTKKNADNTLTTAANTNATYPTDESGFIIYHPHYENYSKHIEVVHEFFLKPKTKKGRETFKTCDLYRLSLPLDKAKQKDWQEEPFRIKVIEKFLKDPSITTALRKQCEEISKDIIRRGKLKILLLKKKKP